MINYSSFSIYRLQVFSFSSTLKSMAVNILVLRRIRPMQHAFSNEVFDLFPMELTEFSYIDGMLHCELHSHKTTYCCWLCVCVRECIGVCVDRK